MEYFLWSNIVVWGSLIAYVLYLRAKSASIRKKLLLGENDPESGGEG
jgi:hypothetical protein